jgi:hypothetical protein
VPFQNDGVYVKNAGADNNPEAANVATLNIPGVTTAATTHSYLLTDGSGAIVSSALVANGVNANGTPNVTYAQDATAVAAYALNATNITGTGNTAGSYLVDTTTGQIVSATAAATALPAVATTDLTPAVLSANNWKVVTPSTVDPLAGFVAATYANAAGAGSAYVASVANGPAGDYLINKTTGAVVSSASALTAVPALATQSGATLTATLAAQGWSFVLPTAPLPNATLLPSTNYGYSQATAFGQGARVNNIAGQGTTTSVAGGVIYSNPAGASTAVGAGGVTTTGTITSGGLLTASNGLVVNNGSTLNGGATVNGGLTVNGGATVNGPLAANNGLAVIGGTTTDTLKVTGNATVGGTLGVTGNATVGGTLGVTSNATVGGTLGVTGLTTASGGVWVPVAPGQTPAGQLTNGGTLINSNGLTIGDSQTTINAVTGTVTVNATGPASQQTVLNATNGNVTVGNNLGVNGNATVGGNLGVTGAATFNGPATFNGGINAGGNRIEDVGTPIASTDAANKAYVDKSTNKAYEGTAVALAISQPVFLPGQNFAIRAGWGDYESQNAFGVSAAGVIARDVFGYGSTVALDAGLGVGTNYNGFGAKAGVTVGFGGGYAPLK